MRAAWAFILACALSVTWLAYGSTSSMPERAAENAWLADEAFALLSKARPHFTDRNEDPFWRQVRLLHAASAIANAAQGDRELAKALYIHGRFETHFARYVSEGRCHDGPVGSRCDEGRARTYFQVWETTCPEAWAEPQGSVVELEKAAVCAARILRAGRVRCKTAEGMFAAMWGQGRCKLERAAVRARAFEALP